jgi:hypothetical protein
MSEAHCGPEAIQADAVRQVAGFMAAASSNGSSPTSWSSLAPATCATSTRALPSAPRPAPPRCTRSTAAARPASPPPPANSAHPRRLAVALSLSATHKAIGFDRPMSEIDFDALGPPGTGILPIGIPGATRAGGAPTGTCDPQATPIVNVPYQADYVFING